MKLNCEKGFTLVELVIGMSIVVILSSVAMFSFSSVERRQLHLAATELKLNLRKAQSMAMHESTNYSIVFLVQENSYVMRRMENGRHVSIKQVHFENVTLNNTTAVGSIVSFTPRGTTGSASTITLQNNSYSVNLTISLGAGRILIHDIIPK